MTCQHDADFAKIAQKGHCCTLAVNTFDDCTLSNRRTANIYAPLLLLIQVTVWQSAALYAMQAAPFMICSDNLKRCPMLLASLCCPLEGGCQHQTLGKPGHMPQMQRILT